jgi:hypothetical protein
VKGLAIGGRLLPMEPVRLVQMLHERSPSALASGQLPAAPAVAASGR